MTPVWEYFLPDYINYWMEAGIPKFVRIFWYFVIFELTRYISIDFLIATYFKLFEKKRNKEWTLARNKLYAGNNN